MLKAGTNSGYWGDTEPTSSLFTVGSGYNNTNRVSRNFISYHWHSVPNYRNLDHMKETNPPMDHS